MVGEAMINSNANRERKRGVAGSFGDVVGDVTCLAELQFDLFKLDCGDSRRQVTLPLIAIGFGLLLMAGLFPVFLLMISAVLYEAAEIPISASIAISLAIGFFVSGATLWLGFHGLNKAMSYFERSSEELKRNVQWLKNLKKRNRQSEAAFNGEERSSIGGRRG